MISLRKGAPVLSVLLAGVSTISAATTPAIGMASTVTGVTLDNLRVSGNATVFEGSSIQAQGFSRIQLKNGTRLDVQAGSKVQVFSNRAALEAGFSEVQSNSGFELDAQSLKIRGNEGSAIARIKIGADNRVFVTALNGTVNVANKEGMLIARVNPGLPMSFLPQAAASGSFDGTGCVVQKAGAALLVDQTGNQVYELRGSDLRKAVGNSVHVTGTVDSSATAAGGASQVVKVGSATITKKGGCSDTAAKIGATTTAAGLAAGMAGATAGGAAVAGGAAAAGAAVGVGTTALVVGGVAAATAAGLGAAAATGAFTTSN